VGKGRQIATQAGKPLAGGMSHGTGMAIALSTKAKRRYVYNEEKNTFDLDANWDPKREYTTQDAVEDSRRASWDQQSAASFIRPGVKKDDVVATVGIAARDIDDKIGSAVAIENDETATAADKQKADRAVLRAFAQQDQMYQSLNFATPEQLEVVQPFFEEQIDIATLPSTIKESLSKTERFNNGDGTFKPVEGSYSRSQLLNMLHSTAEFQAVSKQFYGEAGLESARQQNAVLQNADAEAQARLRGEGGGGGVPPAVPPPLG